MIKKLGQDL